MPTVIEIESPKYVSVKDLVQDTPLYSRKQLVLSILFIYFAPSALNFAGLLLPLQGPGLKGFKNNWVFYIQCFFTLTNAACMQHYWGYFYMKVWFWSPLLILSTLFTVVTIILFEFYANVSMLAFVLNGFIMFGYMILLNLTGKITGLMKNPEWMKGRNTFLKMRLSFGGTLTLGWIYLITFFLFPNLQILFSIFYAGGVFLIKYISLLITHSTLPKEYYGLASLTIELYHTTFLLFGFPSISGWGTFAIAVIVQLFSTVMMWISITPFWCRLLTFVVSLFTGKKSNKVTPFTPNSSPHLLVSPSQENLLDSESDIEKNTPMNNHTVNSHNSDIIQEGEETKSSTSLLSGFKGDSHFTLGMITASCLSLVAQFLSSFYFIPIVSFMRYSYNRRFFPYAVLTENSFHMTLIFALLSFFMSLCSLMILYFIVKKRYDINIFKSILFPIFIRYKYFIAVLVSGTAYCGLIVVEYQFQFYYYFVEYYT
eukprot:TRINITY_DN168_c0_g1_i2.p1 TRINITY_DN168_c0_g1~~TRINITY_DN168_c0_g1_i2.p1  ORF type:complete len:484 (+),score=48.52 TRINITY_DN168_c0_g1_i2:179-1630(+)